MSRANHHNGSNNEVIICPNKFSGSEAIKIVNKKHLLNGAKVNLIFWGSAWKTSLNRSRQIILRDAKKVLASSYMRELQQYGLNEPAKYNKAFIVDDSEPEPGFTEEDLKQLIIGMVNDGRLSKPDDEGPWLHCVFMPRGIVFEEGGPPTITGLHFSKPFPGSTNKLYIVFVHFASRFHISSVFSHELVEACSDPDGRGIKISSSTFELTGDDEISDICEDARPGGKVNGVKVQPYWSQSHCSCVIPK